MTTNTSTSTVESLRNEPVFRLKPKRNEPTELAACEIKHVGFINQNEKLGDEPLKFPDTKDGKSKLILSLGVIDGYNITVRAYRMNITGYYMVNNDILPVCCLQFLYSKAILSGSLFTLFVYLKLDKFKNSFLTKPQSYVGATVYGNYVMILDTDKEITGNHLIELNDKFCEKYALENIAEKLKNVDISEEEIIKKIKDDTEEKKIFYNKLFSGIKIDNFKNFETLLKDNLLKTIMDPHFPGLIKYALYIRSKKRNEQYNGYNKEYKIPQKIFKVSDYNKDSSLLNKYFDKNSDDSGSDDNDNDNDNK
jgi:hypothetical protein